MSLHNIIIEGEIVSLGYNVLAIYVKNFNKIIYIHKFPPIIGAETVPDLATLSDLSVYESDKILRKDTLKSFWANKNLYQVNGDWKGGEWGSNNLPTTDTTWCTESFIGDFVKLELIKDGIIPYKTRLSKPFVNSDEIILDSETTAWSCNITIKTNGLSKTYSGYVCDKSMDQKAIDVLFVWKNTHGKRFIKILRRGNSHPNVDMPGLQMPGAGEHREPGNRICFKSEVLRAVKEEIGIDNDTLTNSYLLPIGTYNNDKRDPRYWKFSVDQDGSIIEFGIKRKSSTDVYVLYLESDSVIEPKESDPSDMIEINSKRWVDIDSSILLNKDIWMIPEFPIYIKKTIKILNMFDELSIEHKISKKIILN